ncbi:MAG: DUF6044 family protein [candidate division WOR-3 bacterium]|nr:DUF6044 family protein [candidate division WOR-3 bacterium]
MTDRSGRSVNHQKVDVALLVLWGVLCSLQFFVRGQDSYIRWWDEGDASHPVALATAHFPTNSANPHWAHFAICGSDNSSVKSEFYVLVQKVVPGWLGFALLMILQRVIAAVFMYLFVRKTLGLSRIAALSAGVVYPFCLSAFGLGTYNALAEPGIPMFAYVLSQIAGLRSWFLRAFLALVAGFAFGKTANLFIAQPFIFATIVFVLLALAKSNLRASLVTLSAFAVGATVADSGTVWSVFRILDESQRVVVRTSNPSAIPGLLSFLRSVFASFLHAVGKAGPIYVAVCVAVFFTGLLRDRAFSKTAAAFVFCCLMSGPLPFLLISILRLGVFRAFDISRFSISSYFFLAILGAMAVHHVDRGLLLRNPVRSRGSRMAILVSGLVISAVFLLAFEADWELKPPGAAVDLQKVWEACVALSVIALPVTLIFTRRRPPSFVRQLGLAVLPAFATISLSAWLVRDLRSPETYSSMYNRPEYKMVAKLVSRQDGHFRVGTVFPSTTLAPLFALPSGLETVDGYFNIYPLRYHLYWRKVIDGVRVRSSLVRHSFDNWGQRLHLFGEQMETTHRPGFSFAEAFDLNLLSLAGCRYFFSEYEIADCRLRELKLGGKLYVYENPQALPRFFLVSQSRVFEDSVELLDSLAASPVDVLRRTVFLESHRMPLPVDSGTAPAQGTVTIDRYASDRVSLTVDCLSPMILVITNNWSKFWKCEVDGHEQPVFPADFTFQCVSVAAGRHAVQLSYEPRR